MTDKARELLERVLPWSMYLPLNLRGEILDFLAEPKVKSLSEDEIGEGYRTSSGVEKFFDFYAGVRFAEKHHGVGDNNENTNP